MQSYTRGYNRTFDDLFVKTIDSAINRMSLAVNQIGVFPRSQELYPIANSVRQLMLEGQRLQGTAPAYYLANFAHFESVYEEWLAFIRKSVKRARAEYRISQLTDYLRESEEEIAYIRYLCDNMTPSHLDLQLHFYTVVLIAPRDPESSNLDVAEFFGPLYDLRDAYFHDPSPLYLDEYLRFSRELVKHPYYAGTVTKGVDQLELQRVLAKVEELATSLEVHSMLHTLA
jgi:hypothetical protein